MAMIEESDGDAEDDIVLDIADPPPSLPYAYIDDYHAQALLTANGIAPDQGALEAALGHPEAVLRGAAAHVLGSKGLAQSAPQIARLHDSADDLVRVECAYALVRLGRGEYRDSLHASLALPQHAYLGPSLAAGDLARLGDPAGFDVIRQALGYENVIIRVVATKQLLHFAPFHPQLPIYDLFAQALHDQHADIPWLAVRQLGELDTPEARALLERYAATGDDLSLRAVAQRALS